MIDLIHFIDEMKKMTGTDRQNDEVITFMEDNGWFGNRPQFENGRVLLSDEQVRIYSEPLQNFLSAGETTSKDLMATLDEKFPQTANRLRRFYKINEIDEDTMFYINDFLVYRLYKDILLYTDEEATELVAFATDDLTKAHGDVLTFFMAWLNSKKLTKFKKDFILAKRYTGSCNNEAYDFTEYLELAYYLFNDKYIEKNDMFMLASQSQDYTDTWLFLALHFICALRLTDLQRIHRPYLPYEPDEVLEKIGDGTFTDNDCRLVLLSITEKMCMLPLSPHKTTAGKSGMFQSVKFEIPTSCETLFGKLFALAEAHRQVNGDDSPIVRRISTYQEITKNMGEEIGSLFLYGNFRSRGATKSYLQMIELLSDDILKENSSCSHVKGTVLASLARSHSGNFGEFAKTTLTYLKDAKLSGLTPEFVAFELLERGVMSSIASLLLKMVTDGEYTELSVTNQTKIIKELGLSPGEIEGLVKVVNKSNRNAEAIVAEAVENDVDILQALHTIGSGDAFSKQPECSCLLTALHKECPYSDRRQCIGCDYEISTKSTLFLLISEYNRLDNLFLTVDNPQEKQKYKHIITQVVLPKMSEMLSCIRMDYGEELYNEYSQLIKENVNAR